MGFTAFMSLLGLIFEKGRGRAYKKLADAMAELSRTNEQLKTAVCREGRIFRHGSARYSKTGFILSAAWRNLCSSRRIFSPAQIRQDADEIIHTSMQMQEELANLLAMDAIEEGTLPVGPPKSATSRKSPRGSWGIIAPRRRGNRWESITPISGPRPPWSIPAQPCRRWIT